MSYPGNDSLSKEIQQRILDTFQQTIELAEKGSRKEAALGCDFVLRLDPLFEPARWLQDRLGEKDEEIFLDDLKQKLAEGREAFEGALPDVPGVATKPEPDLDGLGDLSLDLPEPEADSLLSVPGGEPGEEAAGGGGVETAAPAPAPAPEAAPGPERGADELFTDLELEPVEEPPKLDLDLGAAAAAPVEEPAAGAAEEPAAPPAAAPPTLEPAEGLPSLDGAPEPAAALDSESEQRVKDLLAEGQAAFEQAEYQSAIDAWSRIFLIDIDHPEANRRIDLARKLKAEVERSVEEALHDGISKLEAGSMDEAREAFVKVLGMQPDHLVAQEYLDKLEAGGLEELPETPVAPVEAPPPVEPAAEPAASVSDVDLDLPTGLEGPVLEEPEPPPEPAAAKPRPRPARKPAARDSRLRAFALIGGGVLALVLVAGWFLFTNWDRFFPNAAEAPAAAAPQTDAITRATNLHSEGKTSIAIAQLRRLAPDHPLYEEAQALIAQWEAATAAEEPPAEVTPQQLAEREDLVSRGRSAFAAGQYLRSQELLTRAAKIAPLDADTAEIRAETEARLEPLKTQIAVFRQGEWEYALRDLWRMSESDPDNLDIRRLMVDCYFNLGVRALQRGDTLTATEHFAEALEIEAGDAELTRLADFAQTYQQRPQDLLYKIFVKYLRFR